MTLKTQTQQISNLLDVLNKLSIVKIDQYFYKLIHNGTLIVWHVQFYGADRHSYPLKRKWMSDTQSDAQPDT